MIYNFTLTAGGKQGERERDTEKGWKYKSSLLLFFFLLFFLSQQIPEWFPDFDYFSFCDCNNLEEEEKQTNKKNRSDVEYLAFSWVMSLGAMVLADVVFARLYKIITAH